MFIQNKRVRNAFIIPLILLILPIIGSFTLDGWNWAWNDYVFAYVIWTVFANIYVYLTRNIKEGSQRIILGICTFLVLACIWVVLATG